jgi:hypothetical protein
MGLCKLSFFFLLFFDKEYILILWRYQLHLASVITYCPSGITDAHNKKKKKITKKKKKSATMILETTVLAPPRQHEKSRFSISKATSQKENRA